MNNTSGPALVSIGFPTGYGVKSDQLPAAQEVQAAVYKIPPFVWCVIFLIVGYVGIRTIMED